MKKLLLKTIFMTSIFLSISAVPKAAPEITSMKELREILANKQPSVIIFYAPWCGACSSMKESINTMSERFKGHARIIKVNVDNEKLKEAMDFCGVEAIPTIIVKNVGVLSEKKLESLLNSLCELPVKKASAPQPAPKKPVSAKARPGKQKSVSAKSTNGKKASQKKSKPKK